MNSTRQERAETYLGLLTLKPISHYSCNLYFNIYYYLEKQYSFSKQLNLHLWNIPTDKFTSIASCTSIGITEIFFLFSLLCLAHCGFSQISLFMSIFLYK